MFSKFKEKLKKAVKIFSKKAEEDTQEEIRGQPIEKKPLQKEVSPKKSPKHKKSKEPIKEINTSKKVEKIQESQSPTPPTIQKPKKESQSEHSPKKGLFQKLTQKLTTKKISQEQFTKLFWDLELILLENNVALEVIEKIKQDLETNIVNQPIRNLNQTILNSLKKSIEETLTNPNINLIKEIQKNEKPYVIVFVGTNGCGKTTTIAKIANLLKENKLNPVLVAADTWRSAAIEQLETHAKKLKIPIVKSTYGSDPAAIAFDGIAMAKARKLDVVLIDTAGRQHSNTNLLKEMEKIIKVSKPNLKIFIGESITGNDCIEQIKQFNESIEIDAIILTKADVDEKGGTAISTTYVSKKPILYLGIGQEYNDLKPFNKKDILNSLDLN